eukprot:641206-Amphidinium_carterae.1
MCCARERRPFTLPTFSITLSDGVASKGTEHNSAPRTIALSAYLMEPWGVTISGASSGLVAAVHEDFDQLM